MIASPAWSVAALFCRAWPLLDSIAASARRTIALAAAGAPGARPAFRPSRIANTAWSCAVLLFRDLPLMESLAAAVIRKISEAEPPALAMTAWSVACLGCAAGPLLAAIAAAAIAPRRRQSEAPGQGEESHDPAGLSSHEGTEVANLGPRELCGILWSVAVLVYAHPPLLHSLAASAIATMI